MLVLSGRTDPDSRSPDRKAHTMRSYIDSIFNYLAGDTMWNEEASGEVDSPTGHFSLVEIPHGEEGDKMVREIENLIGSYREDFPEGEDTDITPGWYVVQTDSNGFVYPSHYDNEDDARDGFESLEKSYAEWYDGGPDA